jgi:hypothetical protein
LRDADAAQVTFATVSPLTAATVCGADATPVRTVVVAAELTVTAPAAFVAVIWTRMYLANCVVVAVNVEEVAPLIAVHVVPSGDDCHT